MWHISFIVDDLRVSSHLPFARKLAVFCKRTTQGQVRWCSTQSLSIFFMLSLVLAWHGVTRADVPNTVAAATTATEPPNPYQSAWPPANSTIQGNTFSAAGPTTTSNGGILSTGPVAAGTSTYQAGHASWLAPADQTAPVIAEQPPRIPADSFTESPWYFKQDAFYWNERVDGANFVKEYGPLSTLGYSHRHGIERYRLEIFGGTVAYDGGAQFNDGTTEPYHDSNGTNYLGVRGEYDMLIEPASWSKFRMFIGVGTRFWVRDLQDTVLPSGDFVAGYQETWWTIYPYFGFETKESLEPGPHFFCSGRIGATPFTYQYSDYFDPDTQLNGTVLYPRCGITGQAELGVRFQRFSLSACFECMTWGESAVVRDSSQPNSTMVTVGAKLGYTF